MWAKRASWLFWPVVIVWVVALRAGFGLWVLAATVVAIWLVATITEGRDSVRRGQDPSSAYVTAGLTMAAAGVAFVVVLGIAARLTPVG